MHMHMCDYMHLMRSNQDSLGTGMSLIAIVMSESKLWNARSLGGGLVLSKLSVKRIQVILLRDIFRFQMPG